MKKLILLTTFLSLAAILCSQDLYLNFDLNKSTPTAPSIKLLENNLESLKLCDSLLLVGHTDTIGSNIFNEELSKKRVLWVNDYLKKKQLKVNTHIDWKGEEQLLDPENNSLNRRVDKFRTRVRFLKNGIQEWSLFRRGGQCKAG